MEYIIMCYAPCMLALFVTGVYHARTQSGVVYLLSALVGLSVNVGAAIQSSPHNQTPQRIKMLMDGGMMHFSNATDATLYACLVTVVCFIIAGRTEPVQRNEVLPYGTEWVVIRM